MNTSPAKIGVFVDVQNIYYTTRDAFGKPFNYRALWQILSLKGDILVANAYATDRGDESQKKFQSALRHIGFNIKLKPYIQRSDGSAKGDWDVGITIDILESAQKVEKIILLSGDGDFDLLVRKVIDDYGCIVNVYGVRELTANSLIESASKFYSITNKFLI